MNILNLSNTFLVLCLFIAELYLTNLCNYVYMSIMLLCIKLKGSPLSSDIRYSVFIILNNNRCMVYATRFSSNRSSVTDNYGGGSGDGGTVMEIWK